MPSAVPFRPLAVCALALSFLFAITAVAAAKKVEADLRVVAKGGKVLDEETLKTAPTTIPTSKKATCFGKGTGGSGKGTKVSFPSALGLLSDAAKSTKALSPLLVTDSFDFGLGICGVGGFSATTKESWYLKVNHKNPELGGETVKLKAGDDVLWALAKYPYPEELALEAPAEATAGVPFEVHVYTYDDRGKRKPAKGVSVPGSTSVTNPQGVSMITINKPTTLRATHTSMIPSNGVGVCVAGACP